MNKSQWPQEILCVALVFAIFFAGCGGHTANPVDRIMPGDENRSCNALKAEIAQLEGDIVRKNNDKDNRDTWNMIEFIGGFIIIVPWFFMDLKKSHEVEIEAFQARKKALMVIYQDKNCEAQSNTTR